MNCKRYILCVLALLLCCQASRSENAAERTLRDFRRMGVPVYEADEVKLLPTATEKFHDLFQVIDQAEHYILLDYFKFQEDSICGELLKRLVEKVRQGVEVRILFDSFGNKNSDQPLSRARLDSIRGAGIGIEGFDPVRFPWLNHLLHRNHHKIAVIDGQLVYTGGMNVADYYLHGKPSVGRWRDMHIRMSGSIVQAYEELFWKMWGKEQGARSKEQGARSKEQGARSKEQGARSKEQENINILSNPLAPCPLPLAPRIPSLAPRFPSPSHRGGRGKRPASCGKPTAPPSTMPTSSYRSSTPTPCSSDKSGQPCAVHCSAASECSSWYRPRATAR